MVDNSLIFAKNDFSGGMNRLSDSSKIGENQLALLVNARSRFNVIEPIQSPSQISGGLPALGNFQGCYAAGSIMLVFISGLAYYKNFAVPSSNFQQIVGFAMDANVSTIFVEFVPASNLNFARTAASDSPSATITLGAQISQSPQCAVVQDGINQPYIIESNGTARVSQNYNAWSIASREYVPIGKQMLYNDGILYVVSVDGSQLFRSVSGRPLDFVVAVDTTGDKVGDAVTTSHTVAYGSISCIKALNTDQSAIFVSTQYQSYMVIPSYAAGDLIYNEPTFTNVPLFSTGALNQFSFIELLGDAAFIAFSNIRSFNAVLQLKNEGKNSPFSVAVSPFFEGIVQSSSCAINFDDYAMFAVRTIHGDCVLVYDTLSATWIAIDKLSGISGIKQFAEVKVNEVRYLFFITADGLYQYYGGATFETVGIYVGDFVTPVKGIEHKHEKVALTFIDNIQTGTVIIAPFTDAKVGNTYYKVLDNPVSAQSAGRAFPFGGSNQDRTRNLEFDLGREKTGVKLGVYLSWNFNAKLLGVQLSTHTQVNTQEQVKLLALSNPLVYGLILNGSLVNSLTDIPANVNVYFYSDKPDITQVTIRDITLAATLLPAAPAVNMGQFYPTLVNGNGEGYTYQVTWTQAAFDYFAALSGTSTILFVSGGNTVVSTPAINYPTLTIGDTL